MAVWQQTGILVDHQDRWRGRAVLGSGGLAGKEASVAGGQSTEPRRTWAFVVILGGSEWLRGGGWLDGWLVGWLAWPGLVWAVLSRCPYRQCRLDPARWPASCLSSHSSRQ